MGFGTFLIEIFRPRKKRRQERDPFAESLLDAMRKLIFGILVLLFGYLFFYAATNFWDVVFNLNDTLESIANKLGIS